MDKEYVTDLFLRDKQDASVRLFSVPKKNNNNNNK